jgi:acetylglutamate kinase
VDGLRYTDPATLAVVRRVSQQENRHLVEALQAQGVRATSITAGVFEAESLDAQRYGLVGKVVGVHTDAVLAAVRARSIPVIASLGETAGGQILNVNADWAANELVKVLQPYKIVFLTGTGGLLDSEGDLIDSINLSTEYEALMAQPWVHSGMRIKIEQIHDLLMQLPPSSSVSITRPDELAKELFTHRGSGTLVRRGEKVRAVEGWGELDLDRLRELIESGFGRKLAPDYFTFTTPYRVFVSEHYRAALVLTLEEGIPHLDKFAVSEDAQGEGLGRAAWQVMRDATPRLFWRSRAENTVNDFYFDESDGCLKGPKWNVFWYGLESWDEIRFAVDHCRARPASLKD